MIIQFYRTLTGTTTPDESGHGSNGNEGGLHISQSFRKGALPSDGLVSYAEMQSAYPIAPTTGLLCNNR